jgi:hypothetical protein
MLLVRTATIRPDDDAAADAVRGVAKRRDLSSQGGDLGAELAAKLPELPVDPFESGVDPPRQVVKPLVGPGHALHRARIDLAGARNARGMWQFRGRF